MPRLVAIIVAACVALTVLVVIRSRQAAAPEQAPVPGSVTKPKGGEKAQRRSGSGGGFGNDSWSGRSGGGSDTALSEEVRKPAPVQLGRTGENTAPSQEGRKLAAEPIPDFRAEKGENGGAITSGGAVGEGVNMLQGTLLSTSFQGSAQAADGTEPILQENVDFSADDGAYFPPNARLAYPNNGGIGNEAGTVSFWLQPIDWTGEETSENSFVQLRNPQSWPNRLQIFKNGVFLRFLLTNNEGQEHNIGYPLSGKGWEKGTLHHVAVTWGESTMRMYVDGNPIETVPYDGQLDVPDGTPLYVGSDLVNGTPGAGARIMGFSVLDHALDHGEIIEIYNSPPTAVG